MTSSRSRALLWGGVVVASLFVHLAAFGGLGELPRSAPPGKRKRPPSLVEMTVSPPPRPAPAAAPVPRLAVARPLRARAPRPADKPLEAPPPPAETPADFTGTTLTNEGPGPGWASATGNGQAMNGPVGTPGARVTGRSADGDGAGSGPPVVASGDLSVAPQAPDLAPVLERHYPSEARKRGLAGKALMRARIMPDGQVRELALLSESGGGFGEACRQALRDSHWTPPRDRDGRPVSTYIQYACRFEVH